MKNLILAGLIAAGAATGASAEGFYVGGNTGTAQVKKFGDWASDVASAGANVEYSSREGSLKLLGGYTLNPYFSVEGGYAHLGEHTMRITAPGYSGKLAFTSDALFVDAVGQLPLNNSFSLFAKVGYAYTDTEATLNDNAGNNSKWTKSEGVVKYGFGGEYVIAKKYAIRAEYEKYPKVGDDNTTGESDIDVLSVGFNYKF